MLKTFEKEIKNHQELEPSWNRDPDDHENRDGTLIEKFLVGCRGIVENHCDDDDGSRKIKKRWADMEDTDTDDMPPDAVYNDI